MCPACEKKYNRQGTNNFSKNFQKTFKKLLTT